MTLSLAVENLFFYFLPSPMLVASNLVVTHGGNSTMILKSGMGCMGLCLVVLEGATLERRKVS
jgi:hypothetical protein